MDELKGFSFLVVDDEPDLREILSDELGCLGAKITVASCGNEALSMIKSSSFDVVLTDANMPNGNGMELIKSIRAIDPKVPIVILITGQSEYDETQVCKAGAAAMFGKPTNMPNLISTLLTLLATSAPKNKETFPFTDTKTNASD